jgi:hypothetical protein
MKTNITHWEEKPENTISESNNYGKFDFLLSDIREMVEVTYPNLSSLRTEDTWSFRFDNGTIVEVWHPDADLNNLEVTIIKNSGIQSSTMKNVSDELVASFVITIIRRITEGAL